jgi:hypothetical protein|tara:strand:- start:911 stop:1267 length:357 start_codon:yes stop_codon:yes gene_type:complete
MAGLTKIKAGALHDDCISASAIDNDVLTGDHVAHNADLPDGVLAATQTAGDSSRKLATTAFVTTAVGAISQDAIVTPQAAQNTRSFSTGNNHLMAGDVTIGENQTYTLSGTAKLIIIG